MVSFNREKLRVDASNMKLACEMLLNGAEEKSFAITILNAVIEAAQRRIAEIEGRKSEPIGIGPGGYDPTKDTDVTGV